MAQPWPPEFETCLRPHCRMLDGDEPLDPDVPLTALGVDSLEVVELIVQLEAAFGVSFPDEALTPEAFATAGTVWRALAGPVSATMPYGAV